MVEYYRYISQMLLERQEWSDKAKRYLDTLNLQHPEEHRLLGDRSLQKH